VGWSEAIWVGWLFWLYRQSRSVEVHPFLPPLHSQTAPQHPNPHLIRCCRSSSARNSAPVAHLSALSRCPLLTSSPPTADSPASPTRGPGWWAAGRPRAAASRRARACMWASCWSRVSWGERGAMSLGVPVLVGWGRGRGWGGLGWGGVGLGLE